MDSAWSTTFALIVCGLLFIYEPAFIKFVTFANKVRGTKTLITKTTLAYAKFAGWFALFFGILSLIVLITL